MTSTRRNQLRVWCKSETAPKSVVGEGSEAVFLTKLLNHLLII